MGLYGALEIAKSGLNAASLGVRTTSHNIANVNTPGYSRQRQVLTTESPQATGDGFLGTGVRQTDVTRAEDSLLLDQLVQHDGQLAATQTQADALSQVEQIVGDDGSGGLGSALNAFYDAWSNLASAGTPGAPLERASVRDTAQTVIDQLHSLDQQLRAQMSALDQRIQHLLPRVNEVLSQIASLNTEIARVEVNNRANDLRDQRDVLLRELGGYLDVDSREQANGSLDISLRNGVPLVVGGTARTLFAAPDPSNPIDPRFVKVYAKNGLAVSDITPLIGSGAIGGLLSARDTTVAGALRSLDVIAFNVSSTVNAVHATGVGANGTVGDFFAQPATVADAARDLGLAAAISASPDAIAAGPTNAPADNRTALALAALRDARAPTYALGDTLGSPTGPTRSVLDQFSAVIADVGVQAQSATSRTKQLSHVMETLENRRDEVAGVSLDEEVSHLVELQAAYQANSRVIKTVSDLLGDLMNVL